MTSPAVPSKAEKFISSIVPVQIGHSKKLNTEVEQLATKHQDRYSFNLENGKSNAKSLHEFSCADANNTELRYLYIVFNTDVNQFYAPLTSLNQLATAGENMSVQTPSFYFTNDYTRTHDKNYVAKFCVFSAYAHLFVVTDDESKWRNDFCCLKRVVKRTRTHASPAATYDETQLIPSKKMTRLKILSQYVDTSFAIVPVIPYALQTVLHSGQASTFDRLMAAFTLHDMANNAVLSSDSVTIKEGTRLHHMTGTVNMPSGGQTNITNKKLAVTNDAHKGRLPDFTKFLELYPCFGPVSLSTKAYNLASAMNGISTARYHVTRDTVLNDTAKNERVLHIYLYDGHLVNEKFRAEMPELVHRLCGETKSEKISILVWSTIRPVPNMYEHTTTISSESSVDIITLQHEQNHALLPTHRRWFTSQENGQLPAIACEYAMNASFVSDFTRLITK